MLILHIHRKKGHSGKEEKEGRREEGEWEEERKKRGKVGEEEEGKRENGRTGRKRRERGRSRSLSAGQALALDYQVGQKARGRRLG